MGLITDKLDEYLRNTPDEILHKDWERLEELSSEGPDMAGLLDCILEIKQTVYACGTSYTVLRDKLRNNIPYTNSDEFYIAA